MLGALALLAGGALRFAGGGHEAAIALARRTNDFGAELVRAHPGRFELLASLPIPAVDAAIAEAGGRSASSARSASR
ncbi:MAG: hypothetical protein D3X82_15035 [Candidatus Leucobacter sulfamidivorax]|nr:hypothetical protein [Candidatus Leucobacter sulfamidivorax]